VYKTGQSAGTAWNPYPGMGPLDERLGILEEIDMAMGTNTYENTIFSGMNIHKSQINPS